MIKLAVPDIGDEEFEEVRKVLQSRQLVHGDKVEELESLVKEYLNMKHAIAVSSGTAALHLALASIDIKFGDEVIVPDFTFPATSNVVELLGAESKFIDINLESLCLDVNKIESKITKNTKVILPVHEFGQCADMDYIMNISQKYKLRVVEDAACALGAEYRGLKAGTIGDIGCFSLHPRKAITTGEGGILVTNNDSIADKLKILRNHGLSYIDGKPQFVEAGFNYRMTNIQGAIGVVQMKKLNNLISKRIENAKKYSELLSSIKGINLPEEMTYGKHVWQTYHITLDEDLVRDDIIQKLKREGIETNFGAYAVHEQPYYRKKYNYCDSEFRNTIYANRYGLALPLHHELNDVDIQFIYEKLKFIVAGK